MKLALSPGTLVYRFNRLRYADDAPMSIECATIVASALPSIELSQSIYRGDTYDFVAELNAGG